jgi:hypothetical protein
MGGESLDFCQASIHSPKGRTLSLTKEEFSCQSIFNIEDFLSKDIFSEK